MSTKTTKTAPAVTLTVAGKDPQAVQGGTGVSEATWHAVVADLFGPSALAAWPMATYCLVRADRGKGAVTDGATLAGVGTPWAVLCHHGTAYGTTSGSAADRARRFLARPELLADGTERRAAICPRCVAGDAPVIGAESSPVKAPAARKPRARKVQPDATDQAVQAVQEAADRKAAREAAIASGHHPES